MPTHRRPARTAGRRALPTEPTTVADAVNDGWTVSAQRHAVRSGDLLRIRRGVVASPTAEATTWDEERTACLQMAKAATLTCDRASVSHLAAALAWGMPTLGQLGRPCVTVQSGTALRTLAGVHLHRATLCPQDITNVHGFRVLQPARTVLDIARERGVEAGLVAADYALHTGLTVPAALAAEWDRCANWPGRRAARIVLASADGRAESPLESLSRLAIVSAHLPTPSLQVPIFDRFGDFVARPDFYWDDFGVIGEADGNLKYDRREAIVAERRRQQKLEELGLMVVRWGWADLRHFEPVARRLTAAFRRSPAPRLHPPRSLSGGFRAG